MTPGFALLSYQAPTLCRPLTGLPAPLAASRLELPARTALNTLLPIPAYPIPDRPQAITRMEAVGDVPPSWMVIRPNRPRGTADPTTLHMNSYGGLAMFWLLSNTVCCTKYCPSLLW